MECQHLNVEWQQYPSLFCLDCLEDIEEEHTA